MAFLLRRPSARTLEERRLFIEGYAFPAALRDALKAEYDPVLSDGQVSVVLDGLRVWFLACLHANGKPLGMPSEAVDAAWHEFILSTRAYHAYCEQAFGHYLHHAPAATMREPIENALRRTLTIAEKHPSPRDLAGTSVPFLFAVDDLVEIDDGNVWTPEAIERLRHSQGAGACSSGGCGGSCGGCGGG